MIYDIRTKEKAIMTIEDITGIPWYEWVKNTNRLRDYYYEDEFIDIILQEHNARLPDFNQVSFVFSHITTSSNACDSIKTSGLLDLCDTYRNSQSELRRFLDSHNIFIDIDRGILKYYDKEYDVSFNRNAPSPRSNTIEERAWCIGRKLYFDFTICGFLSINPDNPYGGNVHLVPEIIWDVDNLLKIELREDWIKETRAYEVVARVEGDNVVIDAEGSDREQMISYILNAYHQAWEYESENIILLKNNVSIPSRDILEVNEFNLWYRN